MRPLDQIFNTKGSDKDRNGYTAIYESLFKHIRNKSITVLEIGVGCKSVMGRSYPPGASLSAWAEYFPKARVFGVDIVKEVTGLTLAEGRVTTQLCDSTNQASVTAFAAGVKRDLGLEGKADTPLFDIIVDDGSHFQVDQLATLRNLWRFVKPGGFFIIEDIGGHGNPVGYAHSHAFHQPRTAVKAVIGLKAGCFVVQDWTHHQSAVMVITKPL